MFRRRSIRCFSLSTVFLASLITGCAEPLVDTPTAPGVTPRATDPAEPPAAAAPGLLTVRRVDVLETPTYPSRLVAQVAGDLPDSCTEIGTVSQSRNGNVITVTVTTERKGESCAEVLRPADIQVWLEPISEPGEYIVRVNGVEQRFKV